MSIRALTRRLSTWRATRRHNKYMARRAAVGMAPPHKPTRAQLDEMAKADGGMPWANTRISTRIRSYTGWPNTR